jgi:hypothetical protein
MPGKRQAFAIFGQFMSQCSQGHRGHSPGLRNKTLL